MSIIKFKAEKVFSETKPTVAFDPMTILTIISVIAEVVKLYRDCKRSPQETAQAMHNPGWLQRLRLRRIVRQNVKNDQDLVETALLRQGKDVTSEEVSLMYKELE